MIDENNEYDKNRLTVIEIVKYLYKKNKRTYLQVAHRQTYKWINKQRQKINKAFYI